MSFKGRTFRYAMRQARREIFREINRIKRRGGGGGCLFYIALIPVAGVVLFELLR